MNFGALYRLTKPGVTYGNLITTIAGYLFAANGVINWAVFTSLTIGTWFVIASACVINNYLDQDIDALMERTRNRPLLTGDVTDTQALVLGALLGTGGIALLALFTNWWVVGVGLFGWITYVWLYGAFSKRKSVHGTLVGALSGAAPILAGYVAVYPRLDWTGVLLFAIIFFWQMPEFYSISIYRVREYAKANVPVSSVIRGVQATVIQILMYTLLTILSLLALAVSPLTSWTYWLIMFVLSIRWLHITIDWLFTDNIEDWARQNFQYALVILIAFSLLIAINPWLP
jgi:protoheme IX farnesyltransferase